MPIQTPESNNSSENKDNIPSLKDKLDNLKKNEKELLEKMYKEKVGIIRKTVNILNNFFFSHEQQMKFVLFANATKFKPKNIDVLDTLRCQQYSSRSNIQSELWKKIVERTTRDIDNVQSEIFVDDEQLTNEDFANFFLLEKEIAETKIKVLNEDFKDNPNEEVNQKLSELNKEIELYDSLLNQIKIKQTVGRRELEKKNQEEEEDQLTQITKKFEEDNNDKQV